MNSDTKKRAEWISEALPEFLETASDDLDRKRAIVSPGNYVSLTSVTSRDITTSIRVLLTAQLKLPITVDGILPACGVNFKRDKTVCLLSLLPTFSFPSLSPSPVSFSLPPTSYLLPPTSYLLPPTSYLLPPTSYLLPTSLRMPQPSAVPPPPLPFSPSPPL
jgi:hypothetical protein